MVTRNEALRVAYIHVEESGAIEGKTTKEFYSKLVKADINGKDQVLRSFVSCLFLPSSLRSSVVDSRINFLLYHFDLFVILYD